MKQVYLLFASLGLAFFIFGLPKMDVNVIDSTFYAKNKAVEKTPKANAQRKHRPLVFKPEQNSLNQGDNTQNWLENALLAPSITAVKSVTVQGGGNPVPGSTLNYSIIVSNTASGSANDATGVSFNDILVNDLTLVAGSVKATPIIVDDSYNCIGNVGINVPAASGLLANDISPNNKPLQATAVNQAGTQGTVVANPDGSFTFTPNAGYSGTTTFTYTVSNGDFANTATVSIVVSAPIWFVNIAAASNGNGTLASPFKDWSNFATANALTGATDPAANQTIFVYSGTYTGAATLKSGQKVLGQGATTTLASFAGVTVPTFSSPALPTTSGTNPNLTSSGTTITLSTGSHTLRGFDMGNSTTDISGASFGTLTTSEMALNGTGRALSLSSGTLATTFTSISSTSSTAEGISLSSVSGTLTSSGGTTITNPTTSGIGVTGSSSVNANFGNTNISGSGSAGLVVAGTTSNTASLTFGDLVIAPDATKEAINYFARGSITCTSGSITSSNTPGSIGGIFIEGANSTNKVTLSMVLNSFTHSGSQVGLNLTNTLGSFAINGTGTTAGSGGTIQNITGNGVYLNNANSVSLNYMSITNTSKSCINAINLSGTCAINNCTFTMGTGSSSAVGNDRRCVNIINKDVALTLNVNNSTFNGNLTTSPDNNHGIAYESTTDASSSTIGTLNIKNSTFNRFNNYAVYTTSTGSAITDVGIQGSSVNYDGGTTYVGGAFHLYNLRSAKTTFNILNNTSLLTKGAFPIEIYSNNFDGSEFTPASGRAMEGKLNGNILTRHSTDAGTAVNILVKGKSNGVVQVNGNTITEGNLTVQVTENTPSAANETARLDATITNNTIEELVNNYGIDVLSGNGNTPVDVNGNGTFSNVINCVKISGNTINPIDGGGLGLIRFRTEGITGGNASRIWRDGTNGISETSSTTYWNSNSNLPNSPGSTPTSTRVRDSGFGVNEFKASGTCLTPANAAAARISVPEYATTEMVQTDSVSTIALESKDVIVEENKIENEAKPSTESTNASAKIAAPLSGETVTVNGTGSGFLLPAGKSTTIVFSATVSSTPSTCAITNVANVSGSNFTTVNSNTTTTNLAVPPINAGSTISATSVCSGGSINLTAACPSGSQLNWFTASSGGSSVSTSSPYSPTNITAATSYYASCTIGSCESARTLVGSVTINPLPSISVSASPAICAGTASFTIPYTGTTGTPTTYSISGTGITTVTNAALPATPITVNISDAGGATGSSYSYTLTVRNANGCVSSNVTGSVTVNTSPTIAVGTILPICTGATSFTIPYTGTTGTPTTYSISGTGITTVTNAALPANSITVNLSSGATGSSISFTLTVRNAGGCTSTNVLGSVPVNPLPTLTKSASPAICAGATSFTIPYTATTETPTTYSISGAGITTVTDATLPATPITVNLSSGAIGSSISYTLTVKNANGCTSSNITGSVTVNPLPTITKSASPAICEGATTFTIPYTATTGTPTLYSISGSGITTVTDASLPVSPITVNLDGGASGSSISYILIVRNANGCLSNNVSGSVTVNSTPAPTAPTATPSSRTTAGSVTLSASGCSGGTLTWYNASTNVAVPSPNNQPNFTTSGTYNFYAKCTGTNTCVSNASANVSVAVTLCTGLASSPGNVGINWTGLESTDWNNPCNWSPAWVPNATNSAVVIDSRTNQPTISGTVPSVKLIYVNSGATLTVSSGGTLNASVSGTAGVLTLQGGNLINDGTINVSGGGSGVGISIGATANITNRGTINTNNLYGVSLDFGNLTFTNESTGIVNGDFKANDNILTLTNRGTINYNIGSTYALSLGSAGSSVINNGTISITVGSGISNPSGSTITNNACGKILMTTDLYENGGTTTNAGLIQMPNLYNFTNTGTFTNNGVLKANTVSGITNNRMVITNACPIFTLAGSNNYTVSGIFTDAGATTSAGTYISVGNKFTANNTIPTGTQTLYAQVTNGTCTFVVPFDFNNRKPTAVSVNNTTICPNGSVTLSGNCTAGTLTWYTTATGGSNIGTGNNLSQSPTATTTYYASCETTNCVSGRVATSAVSVSSLPNASANSNSPICAGSTLNLTSGSEGNTYVWRGPNSFTSTDLSPSIAGATTLATGTYTITVTNAAGCTAVATTAVVVNAVPTATASSNSPVCVGNSISLTGGGVGTYAWSGPNGYSSAVQNPTITNSTNLQSGTYTITVTGTGNCTSTATTAVTVNGSATASVTPSTQTICSGGAITTIAITGTGTSYTWTRDNTTSATGIAANGSGNISGSLTNATEAPITVTFTITPVGACNGTPVTATVVVNPTPTVTASTPSQSICSGASITGITFNNPPAFGLPADPSTDIVPTEKPSTSQAIAFSSFVSGTVFNWTRDNTATVIGIPASGTGNISGNLTNTTASAVTVTFTVTPSYTNAGTTCTGTPITVTVTVNPIPLATITDAGTGFCSGSSTTLSAPANSGATYAWERSLSGIANPNSFTTFGGTAQTQVITTSGVYRVIVTKNNCSASDTTAVKFGDFVFSGSLTTGDATQTGRMNRFGVVSTCATPKGYPGDFTTSGVRLYDSYTVTNPTSAPICATIGISSGCGVNIFSAAYLGSYNPASLSTNYLADPGSSFPNTAFYEATIPANGTIVVVVHETNTGTGCSSYNLRVDVPGATVTPTASSNSPICAGNTLNLTGTGTGTYAWSGPNNFTSTEQNPSITNATTLATGTYTISVTNTNGCAFNATTAVTVNATPTATASSNTPAVCTGNTISLTGGGIGTYAWSGPNSFTSTVQSPTISNATTLATGTYTITVTNANNCTSTATVSVMVNTSPTATASSNSPVCVGNTINLLGGGLSVPTLAPSGSYAWTGPNSFSSALQNPSIPSATSGATGTYQLIITNNNGCTAMATTAVTVNALPIAVASSSTPVICAGSMLNLSASGGTSYAWTGVNSFTSNQQNPTISSATTLATGTYRVVVTNAAGCTAIATTSVTVNAFPTATASSNTPVCAGSALSLSASGGTSYAWTGVNSFSSTEQNPTIALVTNAANGTYQVVVTNVAGCTAVATTSVIVNALPTATATSNSPICAGNTANLFGGGLSVPTFAPSGSYAWSGPNSFSSTLQNPSIISATTLATGTYQVVVTNENGCTAMATTALVVNALPTATASSNSPICGGTTLSLSASGGGSYAWSGVNSFTSTLQNPSITSATTLATGTYQVVVTNAAGCTVVATTSAIVNPTPVTPTTQANTQIIFGGSVILTATGCSGENDVLKWYQSADNVLVTMPVSPTVTSNYYAKCETTLNSLTCISPQSADVTVTVLSPTPPVATGGTTCISSPLTLTATGCSGSTGTFELKWYQNSDNTLVTMPVSPSVTTDYYAKCEQTFNSITAVSDKSNVVTLTVLNPAIPVATGATIYKGNSTSLTATGCSGEGFVVKWYETATNNLVTMPVSPTVTTQYYAKCEQTANTVTCISGKSDDVTVTVVNRIFVDITKVSAPIQNGNSWATAYGNLQTGLAAATAGVEVWVAKGTYKPTNTTTRTIYFNIPNSVIVYGGFAGTEDALSERNFRTNVSILSGDIGNQGDITDNSYHVVLFNGSSNSTVLNGFTITGGNANFNPNRTVNLPLTNVTSTTTIESGGGIALQNAAMPMIVNCNINSNSSIFGGGLFAGDASKPTILFCMFMGNQATFGAGIYLQDGSHATISNTLISGNRGVGGLYNNYSNPTITNTTFSGNGGYNGGIFNSNSQPVVKNSIIWGNSTPFNDTQSIITYSIIQGGYAGTGNLNYDPKFVNQAPEGLSPNLNGDYHLQASSLGINRGDNGSISLTDLDLDGNFRRYNGGKVDIGAYEFQGNGTASVVISIASGKWEINSTWDVNRVPQVGDIVIIDQNHIVTLNGEGSAKNIEYRGTGTLKFNSTSSKLNIGF